MSSSASTKTQASRTWRVGKDLAGRNLLAHVRDRQSSERSKTKKGPQQRNRRIVTTSHSKHREGINLRKRQKVPKMSADQHIRVQERCRILADDYFPVNGRNDIVIDDESYFLLKDDNVRGNDSIWTKDINSCPAEVRCVEKEKFQKKLLVHAAISRKGMSSLYFVPAGNSINAEVYKNILRTNVIPFIRENHSNNRYHFWMDLVSSHYANSTLDFLKEERIRFIPKEANPPAVASLRPIEDLWAALKKLVYEGGWEANDFDALKRRIAAKARLLPLEIILNLFRTVRERIHLCAENGYLAVHR